MRLEDEVLVEETERKWYLRSVFVAKISTWKVSVEGGQS